MNKNSNIRVLNLEDYNKGYINLLNQLTLGTDITYEVFVNLFENLEKNIHIFVIEDNNKIITTGTLLIEQKFIHNGGKVGHIEDIVVDSETRGKGVGREIVSYLINKARDYGCYKVILNCSYKNTGFYEKLGFNNNNEIEMRIDFIPIF